ncbi:hypothetical protein ARAM_004503 [Aspergillus rambellii]|uniref:Uncharacterized protein n=1 Tax=Aspergillus rambellii TaxID=308745 RepID=A0A0F8UN04_9EURO|nr:hypothetical protein ARAM_004503 [Aspergillus rambellii]
MDSETGDGNVNYNEVLIQISTNLTNALGTFGSSSPQYQAVLEMLKDCLRQIDRDMSEKPQALNPDTLSLALGFLEIAK